MALPGSLLRRRRPPAGTAGRNERGATLSEYALLASLVVVTSIGAIAQLEDESGSYLVDTGSDIGTPRALAADINDDLPEAPAWLTQPPSPETPPPTPAPTPDPTPAPTPDPTPAPTPDPTPAPTPDPTPAPTPDPTPAPTPAPSYPTGAVIVEGPMSSRNNTDQCFQAESPGVAASSTSRHDCDNGADQELAAVGTASVVALRFTDAANNGLCLSTTGVTVVMAACNGATAQLFNLTISNNGNGNRYLFASQASPTLCLTERSTGLELENCTNSDRQRFTFE